MIVSHVNRRSEIGQFGEGPRPKTDFGRRKDKIRSVEQDNNA